MTHAIDEPTLEAAIVRHCSPTLAALKPASLFTFPGRFVPEGPRQGKEVARRRRALCELVAHVGIDLQGFGLAVRILAWRPCGALIFVYRPVELAACLGEERVAERLRSEGYDPADIEGCLAALGHRLAAAGKRGQECFEQLDGQPRPCPCDHDACADAFPHEVGFFLGYPFDDVTGFIENEGRRYLASGLWKVYGNLEEALAAFARYKRCTSAYETAYRRHGKLSRLAVATS